MIPDQVVKPLPNGTRSVSRRKRDPAANRRHQRDWRTRQKLCQAVSGHVVYGDHVLAMLVARGYVREHETDNIREVTLAISLFLDDHARLDAQR